jgi:hypothetical protein
MKRIKGATLGRIMIDAHTPDNFRQLLPQSIFEDARRKVVATLFDEGLSNLRRNLSADSARCIAVARRYWAGVTLDRGAVCVYLDLPNNNSSNPSN